MSRAPRCSLLRLEQGYPAIAWASHDTKGWEYSTRLDTPGSDDVVVMAAFLGDGRMVGGVGQGGGVCSPVPIGELDGCPGRCGDGWREWNAEESMLSLCMGGDSAEVVHVHDHNTTPGDRSWWPPCGSLTPLAESWWPPCGSLTHPFRELVSAVMIGVEGEGGDDGWLPKMAGNAWPAGWER